jgi:hypothetical protein
MRYLPEGMHSRIGPARAMNPAKLTGKLLDDCLQFTLYRTPSGRLKLKTGEIRSVVFQCQAH